MPRLPEPLYLGIDVAFARGKRLPVLFARRVGAGESSRLEPLPIRAASLPRPPAGRGNVAALEPAAVRGFARETLAWVEAMEAHLGGRVARVALDCPSAPARAGIRRRACERAMDARGVSCFATPGPSQWRVIRASARAHLDRGGAVSRLPHANQLWMLASFELFRVLGRRYACREVFPQATVVALGAGARHKAKTQGYREQLRAAGAATGHPDAASLDTRLRAASFGSRHDRLDAYLCAWVASLETRELEACGEPPDDVIWIPRRTR